MKFLVAFLFSVTANAYTFDQCSAKAEFCPEDGSYQGCRAVVDKVERFCSPHEMNPYDCRNFCEALANDFYPWP